MPDDRASDWPSRRMLLDGLEYLFRNPPCEAELSFVGQHIASLLTGRVVANDCSNRVSISSHYHGVAMAYIEGNAGLPARWIVSEQCFWNPEVPGANFHHSFEAIDIPQDSAVSVKDDHAAWLIRHTEFSGDQEQASQQKQH